MIIGTRRASGSNIFDIVENIFLLVTSCRGERRGGFTLNNVISDRKTNPLSNLEHYE